MSELGTANAAPDRLRELVGRVDAAPGFAEVVASLSAGHGATLDGVWGSSCALVAAALAGHAPATLVVVCAHPGDVDDFVDDLALFTPVESARFPAWEASIAEQLIHDEVFGDRVRLLKQLAAGSGVAGAEPAPRLIVTSIQSLLQPVPARQRLARQTRTLAIGDTVEIEGLARWLAEQGFHGTTAVELPGEFSLRGGILDVFAPDWYEPVRIEFFGDDVESIRRFEVASQRSLASLDAVDITILEPSATDGEHFANYLPPASWFLLLEPAEIEQEGRHYLTRLERPQDVHSVTDVMREVYRFPSVTAASIAAASLETTCQLKIESVERFSGDIGRVRQELDAAGAGQEVFVVCQTEAEAKRLEEVFAGTRLAADGRLHFPLGRLREGFRLVAELVALVSGSELFHRADLTRPSRRRLGRVIDSFLELREGDYVVHLSHGIGRYLGLKLLEKESQAEEHLEIEFHGGTKVYVPASKIDLVQKYVGGAKSRPALAHVGGRMWPRQKEAAERAVIDLASDMLDLQAARASQPGITFPDDSEWQQEFDASFPYTETPDQLVGIAAIKGDMRQHRPMDRLVCGDVGYGKTELAMRAAFKAVDSGFQVAVLVPTTILAEQHGRTFRARMAEFPFEIAVLSRFCSPKEEKRIVAGLADGSIDIVIGTHRLAQEDIGFHNLGLVVIDEEQRFGVDVKERLKAFRTTVDVLTMTATPIPRTLHMSLLGLRDISNLETPPADRLAIETRVARADPDLIRHAVLRELNRGGQIFFVHNRIHDIQNLAWQLGSIVPEASVRIGHGQMAEGELERVMLDFVDHKFDVLLATTIVESGLDIPNANTMFIDDADRYGLADLHQLRGRVGRYKHRAYCYLLLDPNRALSPNAAKRLHAIEEFSDMGAGFAIAMRDLEIRGAGNILGTEQSGHISAVGYELYCELLEQAVRKLKKLPGRKIIDINIDLPGEAYIPRRYVPDMRLKIDLYRRLGRVATEEELADLSAELVDRFGAHPDPLSRLLSLVEVRILAQRWLIESIHMEEGFIVLAYRDRSLVEQLAKAGKGRLRVVDASSAYLPIRKDLTNPDSIHAVIKALLRAG
ncbi:MAG: transcription-repair coupling factor [Planctomycetia bacterium]|nr:transcription-repair coupling factor [Planctomycetia bacterium]